MKNKKFFAKALAFAMVMGTVGAHGIVASPVSLVKAASTPPAFGTPDYDKFTVEITAGQADGASAKDTYVCLQVLKDAKGSKVSAEYWYKVDSTSSKVTVDLSFLKSTKVQYIRACAIDGTLSSILTIPAQPKTVVKYDAKTGKFVDKAKSEITDLNKYEYKSLYGGEWIVSDSSTNGLADFDLATATVAGTTIVVRSAASTATGSEKLIGTETKVKISAAAKAPKIKVNYAKGTITLPKDSAVLLVGGTKSDTTKLAGSFTSQQILEKLGETAANVTTKITKGYALVVRTEKTNKTPSNVTVLSIPASSMLSLPDNSTGTFSIGSTATSISITEKLTSSTLKFEKGTTKDIKLTATSGSNGAASFRYSTDNGKTWTTVISSASSGTSVEIDYAETIKVSVLPEEGKFPSNELEITCTK